MVAGAEPLGPVWPLLLAALAVPLLILALYVPRPRSAWPRPCRSDAYACDFEIPSCFFDDAGDIFCLCDELDDEGDGDFLEPLE